MSEQFAAANRWTVRAGVLAVVLGVVVLLVGDAPAVDGSLLAVVLGFATVVLGLLYAVDRYYGAGETVSPPTTEPGYRVPVPGDECDPAGEEASTRLAFERRLSRLVVAALVDEHGLSPADAERRVDQGTWTDDRAAAALLDEGGFDLPALVRWRWRLRGRDPVEYSAERAVAAFEALREDER